jgi:hypothetical protein
MRSTRFKRFYHEKWLQRHVTKRWPHIPSTAEYSFYVLLEQIKNVLLDIVNPK